jgi:hypothetical protein
MLRLPSYAAWLARQDFARPYALYHDVLKLLQANDSRRFVLKAPAHTAELDHLAAAFPGAVVIPIHRDIVTTVTSGTNLFAVYQSTYSDDVDPLDVGRRQLDHSELWFRRAHEFRSSQDRAVTLVDLDYRGLVPRRDVSDLKGSPACPSRCRSTPSTGCKHWVPPPRRCSPAGIGHSPIHRRGRTSSR